MKLNDFFCNCKTQSCTSASGTSCNIKTIKLFKNAYKLFFWNGIAAIGKLNGQPEKHGFRIVADLPIDFHFQFDTSC